MSSFSLPIKTFNSIFIRSVVKLLLAGISLEGDLREKVSLRWLTYPYFELREKFKCIKHIGKSKIRTKTPPCNPENVANFLPVWKLYADPWLVNALIIIIYHNYRAAQ